MRKLIIEARVNEYMPREQGNPHVPYLPAEIADDAVACRAAGASVVHFHARKPDGAPEHAAESYGETVGLIRAASDILVHPTLGYVTLDQSAEERLAHILDMSRDGARAPHFAPMDMGSVNVDRYNAQGRRFETHNLVYRNSTETLTYFAKHIRAAGLKPYLVSWNVGFTRYMSAFLDMGLIDEPAYLCFCLTDNTFLGGHPGTLKGLQAHLDFLPPERQVEWTVCNFGGNLVLPRRTDHRPGRAYLDRARGLSLSRARPAHERRAHRPRRGDRPGARSRGRHARRGARDPGHALTDAPRARPAAPQRRRGRARSTRCSRSVSRSSSASITSSTSPTGRCSCGPRSAALYAVTALGWPLPLAALAAVAVGAALRPSSSTSWRSGRSGPARLPNSQPSCHRSASGSSC